MSNEQEENVKRSLDEMLEILQGTYVYPDGTQPTASESMQLIAARAAIVTATCENSQPSMVLFGWAKLLNEAEAEVVEDMNNQFQNFVAQIAANN